MLIEKSSLVFRSSYHHEKYNALTDVDVLFGKDTIDPRPRRTLIQPPLQLNPQPDLPCALLSVRYDAAKAGDDAPQSTLRVKEDGTFKIVQISDMHMVTGVGTCNDAIDGHGQPLPESEADPLTVKFVEGILDVEKPDLVIFTGDQLHHDISDSKSALLKVVAPLIERSIPYAAVFGNHDDEGAFALSRR